MENNCYYKVKFFIDEITFNQIQSYVGYDVKYGVDRIVFLSKETKHNAELLLKKIRGKRGISKKLGNIKVYDLSRQDSSYKKEGYCCKIILTGVTQELLNIIYPVNFLFTRPDLIDVFQDIVCNDRYEAVQLTKHQILHAYMIYCNGGCEPLVMISGRPETLTRRKAPKEITEAQYEDWCWNRIPKRKGKDGVYRTKNDPTIIGDWTIYLGKEDLIYTIYARLSKQGDRPVIHSEFRIKGYDRMQKMGVLGKEDSTLDAITEKVMLRVSQIYKKHLKKRIKFNKINEEKVAKHFLGLAKVKCPDDKQKRKISGYLNTLKRTYSLECTAYFMQYFKYNKLDYRRFVRRTA